MKTYYEWLKENYLTNHSSKIAKKMFIKGKFYYKEALRILEANNKKSNNLSFDELLTSLNDVSFKDIIAINTVQTKKEVKNNNYLLLINNARNNSDQLCQIFEQLKVNKGHYSKKINNIEDFIKIFNIKINLFYKSTLEKVKLDYQDTKDKSINKKVDFIKFINYLYSNPQKYNRIERFVIKTEIRKIEDIFGNDLYEYINDSKTKIINDINLIKDINQEYSKYFDGIDKFFNIYETFYKGQKNKNDIIKIINQDINKDLLLKIEEYNLNEKIRLEKEKEEMLKNKNAQKKWDGNCN